MYQLHRHLRRLALSAILLAPHPVKTVEAKEPHHEKQDPYEVLAHLGEALAVVEENYFEPVDRGELLDGALRGMVSGLDPHSTYFSKDDLNIFLGDTEGEFGGIGIEVDFRDNKLVVIAPIEGSPAARAGIAPGDIIIALEGKPIQGFKPDELIQRMRGEIGTELKITIRRKRDGAAVDLVLMREKITVSSVLSATMNSGIGYLKIKSFQVGTHRDLLRELGGLRRQLGSVSALILDLRNNPGGLVREATGVADEFLSSGVIYSTRSRGEVVRTVFASSSGAFTTGPLIVLINEFSASAAELVAGALRDHSRAIIVGARSFGKGSVQTVLPVGREAALKLTTALYYTPNGSTLQARGVLPHVRVNPGYGDRADFRIIRESDLDGHIGESSGGQGVLTGPPPTNEELHLGVLRKVPQDPTGSGDLALEVAYRIALGELPHAPKPPQPWSELAP